MQREQGAGRDSDLLPAGRGRQLMRSAMEQPRLTARAFHRILELARTVADLAGSAAI